MKRLTFTRHPVGGDRRFFVLEEDVRVLYARLPRGEIRHLARVRFDDLGWTTYQAGYASPGGREVALCALPPRVSLTRFLGPKQSPSEFGAVRGSQWPALAIRRYQLYHVFLRELARLEGVAPTRELDRRADALRRQLWEAGSEPGVHAAPGEEERAAIAEHWEPAHAAYKRALLDERDGQPERALAGYRTAVERFPEHALAREALGRAALEEGEWDEALAHFDAALAADPAHPDVLLWSARAHLERGERERARTAFEGATQVHPQAAVALAFYADALASWDEPEQAELRYKKALRKDPNNALVHRHVAAFHERRGDDERSAEHLRRAVELDPDHRATRAAWEQHRNSSAPGDDEDDLADQSPTGQSSTGQSSTGQSSTGQSAGDPSPTRQPPETRAPETPRR